MTDTYLRVLCQKTKLCKFFILGECGRGEDCSFAHHVDEMRQAPDLSFAKLCPTLIRKGRCQDPQCRFAHSGDQIRSGLHMAGPTIMPQTRWPDPQRQVARAHQDADEADMQRAHGPSTRSIGTQTEPCLSSDEGRSDCSERVAAISSKAEEERGKKAAQVMRNKFHRTKLCAFYATGCCRKGNLCNFAHTATEIPPLPDVCCERLRPRLGHCQYLERSSAHCEEELRPADAPPSSAGAAEHDFLSTTCASSIIDDCRRSQSGADESEDLIDEAEGFGIRLLRQGTEDPSKLLAHQLRVKNTFLDIYSEDAENGSLELCARKRVRARSAQPRLEDPTEASHSVHGMDSA